MNTKHTPGPWVIRERTGRLHITPADNEFFMCAAASGFNQAEAQANARLIAAAPELIHAVELANAQLRKMGYECDCENLPTQCPLCACSTAIAKAKGE